MQRISDGTLLAIWIITGVAGIVLAALYIYLENNIRHSLKKLFRQDRGGRRPSPKPVFVWIIFLLTAGISIVGAAIASTARSNHDTFPTLTPLPRPTTTITMLTPIISEPTPAITQTSSPLQTQTVTSDPDNLDFETLGSWSFSTNGQYWKGQYSSDWASSGLKSYQIYILTDQVGSIYPGANTYAEIYQNVDLSGVSELLFDMNAYGDWDVPEISEDSYLSLEVWIDDQMIFSHERQIGIYNDQSVSLIGFTGIHRLTFRLIIHDDYNALPPGLGLYLDNLRIIRTGATDQSQNDISNFKILVIDENYMQVQVDYTYNGSEGSGIIFLGIHAVLTDGNTLSQLSYTAEQVAVGNGTRTAILWFDSLEPGTYDIVAFKACFHVSGQHSFYCKEFPYTMVLHK